MFHPKNTNEVPLSIDVDEAYRRYGPMVLRRCRRLLGDEERALDAMQDTFILLLRHGARLEDRGTSSLLYRMATNVCLNRLRSTRRKPEDRDEALLAAIASTSDVGERTQARSVLSVLFGRQPESSATIAVLHWLDGLTLEEVAAEVGMSVSGVRKRLRALREELVRQHGVELADVEAA